ncbi:MAG TPA: hypothetical protein DCE78_12210, partial [Bacteroidetes bacterium]|nr:hypothetical protein [Bacteroidota bacterium]
MNQYLTKLMLGLMGLVLSASALQAQFYQQPTTEAPKHEFRSIWIATVPGATDWPKGATTQAKQDYLREIIQEHVKAKMNAIVFQTVGRGDALFQSERLPWNISLEGLGVDPGWDPLQFVIDEAQKYGLEVHAWYNVFNVGNSSFKAQYEASSNPEHVYKANPEWIKEVPLDGGGFGYWLNPGIPAARQWAVDNVIEIVENYDVDAVHFDFARYPNSFTDDQQTRDEYDDSGFTGAMDDWRRNNVNEFQRDVYAAVQDVKPWVKVGTTPIGHYKESQWPTPWNENCPYYVSPAQAPCSWGANRAYFQVFQDAITWINEGVNDYIAPQLYWAIGPPGPHFDFLAQDWRKNSEASGKHVYIGIGAYQTTPGTNVAAEIDDQVDLIRENNHAGHMFFRFDQTIFEGPPNFQEKKSKIDYGTRAFVPVMDWKDIDVPPAVDIARETLMASIVDDGNDITLTWDAPAFETASGDTKISYAVYRVNDNSVPDVMTAMEDPANLYALTGETTFTDRITEAGQYYYFVTAYSRNWVESAPSNVVEHFTATSVESGDEIASAFKLDQNYPNPFNPTTQIRYAIGESVHTNLTVYDALGRQVATLINETMPAGN